MLKIITFTAHPDDNAFIAGTYLKLANLGWKITEVVMTKGEGGVDKSKSNISLATLRSKEVKDFAKLTGINGTIQLSFPDGKVSKNTKLEENIIKLLRKYKPQVVITHHSLDYHLDHVSTFKIVKRCLEKATRNYLPKLGEKLNQPVLLVFDGYNLLSNPNLYCNTSYTHKTKMDLLAKSYGSQLSRKLYNFIDYQNKLRGARVNIDTAEAFQTSTYRNFKHTSENSGAFYNLILDFSKETNES